MARKEGARERLVRTGYYYAVGRHALPPVVRTILKHRTKRVPRKTR